MQSLPLIGHVAMPVYMQLASRKFMHKCGFLAVLGDVRLSFYCETAFLEQSAVLSTAWANEPELKTLGVQGSLCVIAGKKLLRTFLIALHVSFRLCMHGCAGMMVTHGQIMPQQACDCASVEQAVYQ